jgi:hypothetical protein
VYSGASGGIDFEALTKDVHRAPVGYSRW